MMNDSEKNVKYIEMLKPIRWWHHSDSLAGGSYNRVTAPVWRNLSDTVVSDNYAGTVLARRSKQRPVYHHDYREWQFNSQLDIRRWLCISSTHLCFQLSQSEKVKSEYLDPCWYVCFRWLTAILVIKIAQGGHFCPRNPKVIGWWTTLSYLNCTINGLEEITCLCDLLFWRSKAEIATVASYSYLVQNVLKAQTVGLGFLIWFS